MAKAALGLGGALASRAWVGAALGGELTSRRPVPDRRAFTSAAVEARIAAVKKTIADPELAWLFEDCFPNTLDTTVRYREVDGHPDTFVITGDIPAMWLRDSTAQVWPYLPLATEDGPLARLLLGVVRRQTRCILIDPYANAFNEGPTGSEWASDRTAMKPELHERKWEIDSLCYPVRLAHGYWKATGDASAFDADWRRAAASIVATLREQQRLRGEGPYRFERVTARAIDTLPLDGRGNPTRPCGLIHSAFRPSDDACIFPFLVPSNLFAARALEMLAEIHEQVVGDRAFAQDCRAFTEEIRGAVRREAYAEHLGYGTVMAYETDGLGNRLFMDDANVPSLLSLPYLGLIDAKESVYRNTRRFVLSEDDAYFSRGTAGEGIGGPHVGRGMIWPLSIVMRALTSDDDGEIARCLATLKATHAGTGFMHESFWKDDATRYTRGWFAWANTLFGELILKLAQERPALLSRTA
jgi:meiotically up-regulated gene 157 (Mug157) protein